MSSSHAPAHGAHGRDRGGRRPRRRLGRLRSGSPGGRSRCACAGRAAARRRGNPNGDGDVERARRRWRVSARRCVPRQAGAREDRVHRLLSRPRRPGARDERRGARRGAAGRGHGPPPARSHEPAGGLRGRCGGEPLPRAPAWRRGCGGRRQRRARHGDAPSGRDPGLGERAAVRLCRNERRRRPRACQAHGRGRGGALRAGAGRRTTRCRPLAAAARPQSRAVVPAACGQDRPPDARCRCYLAPGPLHARARSVPGASSSRRRRARPACSSQSSSRCRRRPAAAGSGASRRTSSCGSPRTRASAAWRSRRASRTRAARCRARRRARSRQWPHAARRGDAGHGQRDLARSRGERDDGR